MIEGVMMRAPNRISVAVRKPEGEIQVQGWEFTSLTKRGKFYRLPVIRGVVNLVEMLYWGIKTLQYSAQVAAEGEMKNAKSTKNGALMSTISLILGLVLGVFLFAYLPLAISNYLGFREKPLVFNTFAGVVRVGLFLGYIGVISFMRDVRRLFRYHGAEHKVINAFEHGEPLVVERIQKYPTLHPRCGTSFILFVAVIAILVFAIFDSAVYALWGFAPGPLIRLPLHLALLPVLAGLSYEALKLSDKLSQKGFWGKLISAPGLLLQKLTTAQPDDRMVEVALTAFMDAISNVSLKDGKK